MNNHFHLQHDHTPQNVAAQFLQHTTAPPTGSTSFSYLPQVGTTAAAATSIQLPQQLNQQQQQQQQWMTYQIVPSGQTMTIASRGDTKRFYTPTTSTAPQPTHSNTIQITNNYAQHQLTPPKQQSTPLAMAGTTSSPFKANNIRIISTAPNVYNLNKTTDQLFAPTSTTTPEIYAPVSSTTMQSFYLPSTAAGVVTSNLNRLVANNNSPGKLLPQSQPLSSAAQPPPLVSVSSNVGVNRAANAGSTSAVVLDRINICINNHYAESVQPPTLSNAFSAPQQQPSPIIPAIQHKALLPLIDSSTADSSCSSSSSMSRSSSAADSSSIASSITGSAALIVIDEPDSTTTTPHTPPTTPEMISSPLKTEQISAVEVVSPSALAATQIIQSFATAAHHIENDAPLTPPTPPPPPSPATITYDLQEDVFIKCNDGRFYLGTIIDHVDNQYLVRFDDKSKQWCGSEKLRKLGGGNTKANDTITAGPMCVVCKQEQQDDVVEICERCGRGCHRGCTTEIAAGSGIWSCKRCAKPMKMQQAIRDLGKPPGICRQLPYHADKLSWDKKHRVNEEQIYCYCGKAGKFDHNMLQCCKCQNWFHTQCMQNFKRKLLRGDMFFIFCCTVCNDGVEFVRRLQIDWIDVLHIALYNLCKNQHQKYHHLLKDIWPFILEKRAELPICEEWKLLPETALMERIKATLKDHPDRFMCGRELKRAPSYYALRHNGPPLTPKLILQPHEELCDEMLVEKYKLVLLSLSDNSSKVVTDVYDFHSNVEAEAEVLEADTSEDEIPIKQIMEKAKKQTKQQQQQQPVTPTKDEVKGNLRRTPDIADDNANDGQVTKLVAPAPVALNELNTTSSRKRKAFRLSKSYKEIAAKRYDSSRNCDLSSDENSSSSRGTSSLDLIIPPPANFLGRNNPFLMTTPKKDASANHVRNTTYGVGNANGVAGLINSIFNIKSAPAASGLFPKLSATELAKATTQPRMVRTVKRRLSAKDITIGPNQEVRRRRTRRLTTAVEVIHTTTINPIPSHYFPIYAKDLQQQTQPNSNTGKLLPPDKPTHGRLLRQRTQKSYGALGNSRRSSTSSTATNGSGGSSNAGTTNSSTSNGNSMHDLKQSVKQYFGGAMNRIDAGESFSIRAKRRTGSGHIQYLIEWGGDAATTNGGSSN